MTDVTVVITGMILFVSPAAYDQSGKIINAAVAANGTRASVSTYGVEIPIHVTKLRIAKSSVVAPVLKPAGRFFPDGTEYVIELQGDRVQFGTMSAGPCTPLAGSGTLETRPSFVDVPRLDEIVSDKIRLIDGAFPKGGDFKTINPAIANGWLDIPDGILRSRHSHNKINDTVEFRPSRRVVSLPDEVEWTWNSTNADCLLITPFQDPNAAITVNFQPNQRFGARYFNINEDEAKSGEVIKGIGYDWELLWNLLDGVPAPKPLPYALQPPPEPQPSDMSGSHPIKGTTGVNCAPAKVTPGGTGGS